MRLITKLQPNTGYMSYYYDHEVGSKVILIFKTLDWEEGQTEGFVRIASRIRSDRGDLDIGWCEDYDYFCTDEAFNLFKLNSDEEEYHILMEVL